MTKGDDTVVHVNLHEYNRLVNRKTFLETSLSFAAIKYSEAIKSKFFLEKEVERFTREKKVAEREAARLMTEKALLASELKEREGSVVVVERKEEGSLRKRRSSCSVVWEKKAKRGPSRASRPS